MKIFADIKDKTLVFNLSENSHEAILSDEQSVYKYEFKPVGHNRYFFSLDGNSYLVQIHRQKDFYRVIVDGEVFNVNVEDENMRTLRELVSQSSISEGEITISAPIPGLVTRIKVAEGDSIKHGDSLLVLEAMKMENEIKSPENGIVKNIVVKEGVPVEKDEQLIIIKL